MDVINAAKRISELGTKLDRLAREVAELVSRSMGHSFIILKTEEG